MFIRMFDSQYESAITFAILEKERKKKLKILTWYTYWVASCYILSY